MVKTVSPIKNTLHFLRTMQQKGGPQPHDYPFFNQILHDLSLSIQKGEIAREDLNEIHQHFSEDFLQKTLHGHSFRKPYGYAGDFWVIDQVYQNAAHPEYRLWDEFVLQHRTCDGIRNRKEYFKRLLKDKCKSPNIARIDLLNVASGPARDVLELYKECQPSTKLYTHCVEYDPYAIEYARALIAPYHTQISFENENIYKYETNQKYDIIWSSGLFDYFNDKVFVSVLKKFLSWVKPKSEIVLGNITPAHSLKDYMEILMQWPLHIRTSKDLIRLAKASGVKEKQIKIGVEEAGIFLFLHIKT